MFSIFVVNIAPRCSTPPLFLQFKSSNSHVLFKLSTGKKKSTPIDRKLILRGLKLTPSSQKWTLSAFRVKNLLSKA